MVKINNKYYEILYPDISVNQKKCKKYNLKKKLLNDEFNLYKEYYLAINYYLEKYPKADYSLFRSYTYDKKFCKIKFFIRNIYEKNDEIFDDDVSDSEEEDGDDYFKLRLTEQASLFRINILKMQRGEEYRNKDSCHQIKFLNFCYFINSKYRKDEFIKCCCS